MERCRAKGLLGIVCKGTPGTDISTCHAYTECLADPGLKRADLMDTAHGCEFVESGQVPPPSRSDQPPAPATK